MYSHMALAIDLEHAARRDAASRSHDETRSEMIEISALPLRATKGETFTLQ